MKRSTLGVYQDNGDKRPKSSLAFYGTGLHWLKCLSHSEAWHAAKQLVADNLVSVNAVAHDAQHAQLVRLSGSITRYNPNTGSFPHLLEPYARNPSSEFAASQQPVDVQLILNESTGEVLDATCSCCPGGFQSVLGSFCPCITAVLLDAAKQAVVPSDEPASHQQANLPAWSGSSIAAVMAARQQPQQQAQQAGSLCADLCLVQQSLPAAVGLGLEAWEHEQSVNSTVKIHFASQRAESLYGAYYGGARSSDPDKLQSVEDAEDDLANSLWYHNASSASMQAPETFFMDRPLGGSASISDGAQPAGADNGRTAATAQRNLLRHAVKKWLTQYGDGVKDGWERRPNVINQAFSLLIGHACPNPQPLAAVVLLMRALWEYLHVHGLGRLLAKPLKLLLAVRNVLLVSSVPLWLRKSISCQLSIWEKGLLWQHAASPLGVSGNVGMVHLLRVMQEIQQLCLHHWDSPQLVELLTAADAEDQQQVQQDEQSPSAAVILRQQELPSLLQLRLLVLKAVGLQNAYLELAMAGGAWREAINQLLSSKERSQLLKAVSLLPRHIKDLSERLKYMTQLVELESLGSAEKLEVCARLLLGIREELQSKVVEIRVRNPRYPTAYTGHLWKATHYGVAQPTASATAGRAAVRPTELAVDITQQLCNQWRRFMRLFVETAAKALFDAGKEAKAAYDEHIKAQCGDSNDADDPNQQQQQQQQQPDTAGAGSSAAAAAAEGAADAALPAEDPFAGIIQAVSGGAFGPVLQDIASDAVRASLLAQPIGIDQAGQRVSYCPNCGDYHVVEGPRDLATPQGVGPGRPATGPHPGDPSWQLLGIDKYLFNSYNEAREAPAEAISGSLKARGTTGYIEDERVLEAIRKVVPAEYPELLPLCSLDALCLSTLSRAVMQHFDSGGVLDTSLSLDPLKELLSHHLVEMGPAPVRVQAALEVAVYASIMTPLATREPAESDNHYRNLMYMLLAVGQRNLALLVARTRFKMAPGTRSAGELMEVAVASGPVAESEAVDLILGKGLVRDPDADDDRMLAGSGAQVTAEALRGHDLQRLRRAHEFVIYGEMHHHVGLPPPEYDEEGLMSDSEFERDSEDEEGLIDYRYNKLLNEYRNLLGDGRPSRHGGLARDPHDRGTDDDGNGDSDASGSVGDDDEVIDLAGDDDSRDAAARTRSNSRLSEVQRVAAEAAAAAAAAGENPAAAALAAARAAQQPADSVEASSLDTRQLLGDAAGDIQLRDTANSSRKAPTPAPPPAAAARPAAEPVARQEPIRGLQRLYDSDSDDMDEDMMGYDDIMEMEYRRRQPVRDLPAAQLQPRPGRVAGSSSRKRKYSPSPSPAAAAAGGGGGGGGGESDGDDDPVGGASGRRRHSTADNKRRRRSPHHSKDQIADAQQAELVAELFGITESSHSRPARALRVHIRRLSGLQLWAVVKYAAGRGAATDSIRKLGLAAWLSDNTNGNTGSNGTPPPLSQSEQLFWQPVAASQQAWIEAAARQLSIGGKGLPSPPQEPWAGGKMDYPSWSSLPSTNWTSFVCQERMPHQMSHTSAQQHHNSPDAHLAWLIARLSVPDNSQAAAAAASNSLEAAAAAATSSASAAADEGLGYYKDGSAGASAAAAGQPGAAAAAAAAGSAAVPEDNLTAAADVLQQLASISKGLRFGLPVLQLCHALLLSGSRSACLSLLPQGLLPAAANLQGLSPNVCIVAALKELLPAAAKHGDVSLRVSAVMTDMLITRRPVPAAVLADKEVLNGVLSWWLSLVGVLHLKAADWGADKLSNGLNVAETGYHMSHISRGSSWSPLQRMLSKCILPALGGQAPVPGADQSTPEAAAAGLALLLECEAVTSGHWAFKLYLARICLQLQLAKSLMSVSQLIMPALSAAVQQHLAAYQGDDAKPICDINEWKQRRHCRPIMGGHVLGAREWVQATLTWITSELSSNDAKGAGVPAGASSSSSKHVLGKEDLTEFADTLYATVVGMGWYGPELLPLAAAIRKLQQQHKQQPTSALLSLIAAGLLPTVGRADELSRNECVTRGAYKEALRSFMRDTELVAVLDKETVRNLALTYWYQEATPAALLLANDLLIKTEGPSSAQHLTLPAAAGSSNLGMAGGIIASAAAAAAAAAGGGLRPGLGPAVAGGAAGVAGLPAVHAVLLEQLDLVPSRGGLEAAGLRFMQLQMHATAGHMELALESVFNTPPDNGSAQGSSTGPAGTISGRVRLEEAMEVADMVLRLVQDSSSIPDAGPIRMLQSSQPYITLQQLSLPDACCASPGDGLLATLSTSMKKHVLRLTIWRLARTILTRGPGFQRRQASGPQFPCPAGSRQYTNSHPPPQPTYTHTDIQHLWMPFGNSTLCNWCTENQDAVLAVPGTHFGAASRICAIMQSQEEALLWCITRYAQIVSGHQLELDLSSLISLENRARLGMLPVFIMGLGQNVKADRGLMWAYCSFKAVVVASRVDRYISRNAHDMSSLARYIAKSTISEIQAMKATSLPWWDWEMGSKANQAHELAEWLWWYRFTWNALRGAMGAGPQQQIPYVR